MGLDSEKNIDSRFWNLLMRKDFMEKIIFLKDEKEVMAEFEKEGVNPTDEEIKTLKSFLFFIWNKLKECSSEEIEEIKKIGNNLTDEDLEAVSGGYGVVEFRPANTGSQVIEAPSKIAAQSALAGAKDKFQAFTGQRHKLGTELGKTVEQAGEAVNQGGISTDWTKSPSKVPISGGSFWGKLGNIAQGGAQMLAEARAESEGIRFGRWIGRGIKNYFSGNADANPTGSNVVKKNSVVRQNEHKVGNSFDSEYIPEVSPTPKEEKTVVYGPKKRSSSESKKKSSTWAEKNTGSMTHSTAAAKEKAVSKKAVGASSSAVSKPEVAPVSKPAEEKGNAWAVKNLQQMSGPKYGLEVATRSKHKPAKEKNTSLSESNVGGIFSSDYSPKAWSVPESSWEKNITWAEQNTGSMTHSADHATVASKSDAAPISKPAEERQQQKKTMRQTLAEAAAKVGKRKLEEAARQKAAAPISKPAEEKGSVWAEQNTGSMTHSRAQTQLAPGSNPDPQPGGGEKTTDYAKASAKDKPEDEKEKSKTKTARKTLGLKPLAALAVLFGGSKLAKEDSGKNRRSNRRDKEEKEEKRKSEEKQQEEKKTNNYDNIKSGAAVAAAVAMLAIAHMDEIKDFYKKNIGPNIDPIKENLNKHISNIKTWFNT